MLTCISFYKKYILLTSVLTKTYLIKKTSLMRLLFLLFHKCNYLA